MVYVSEQLSILLWWKANGVKTESGQELDFHTHRYLVGIYRDNSPLLVCLKAGQIGFSTMAIIKTLWLAYYKSMRIGYVLPTAEMAQKFVSSKVNPITQQNPIIATWMKDKDAIEQKQVGSGFIHFLGAQTPTAAIMLTMDLLVCDEYDKSPQSIMEMFDSRLQHSEYKWKWVFSNPTRPDFGVDRYWVLSDQKKWHITHSCGHNYIMDESCINYAKELYECPHCHLEITREEIRMGEWIATAKGEWSGYWIPLWINPMITAKVICEHKRTKTKEYFYNFVAGLPYVNDTDMLSQKKLESCLVHEVNAQEGRTIIGMDTGHNLYYTIMNEQGVFYYGYSEKVSENNSKGYDPYDKIDKLMGITYPNAILVADQGGDLIGVRKLQAKYPGRVYLCTFTKETRNLELARWNKDGGTVLVDRNREIQIIVDQINENRLSFNGMLKEWQPFFNHCLNIYRVKDIKENEKDDPQYNWRWIWKRKGPDHWFFSLLYAIVGFEEYGQSGAKFVAKDSLNKFPIGSMTDGSIYGAQVMRRPKNNMPLADI